MSIITKSRITIKSFTLKLLLFLTALFLISGELYPQVDWTKYPGNPVLTGQPGTWYAYVSMNCVLYNADSSRYEMWFTAGAQASFPYTIGYAWSYDGITWIIYSNNPVLTPTPGEWDTYTVLAPYVLRENGEYKMWYTGSATAALLDRIGYATSPDGISWEKHQDPVLEPGTATWESGTVAYPSIMPYSNGYKMWYGGGSAGWSQTAIGYATSPDGINWERYTGNPVLSPGASGQWDHLVYGPRIIVKDNIFYLFYTGEINLYQSDKVGLATSPDGLVWIKYPSNPVLQPTSGQWDGSRTILGSVLMDADTLKMYYAGTNGSAWSIGLAISFPFTPLPLPPGAYTIGNGGNFETIQEAFDKLSTDGVAGEVTLELVDDLYTAPVGQYGFLLDGPIPGAGPDSRVIIKPAENKNVTIEGDGEAVLAFLNISHVNLDGVSLDGSTTLTVHNLMNAQYQWNDCVDFIDNSDHNIVENCILISDGYLKGSSGILFFPVNSTTQAPDSNLIQNNFVKRAGAGIYLGGKNQNTRAVGNIIRGNMVGSETDSLISWGIQDENTQNSIIEYNIVQNINRQHNIGYYAPGINTAYSSGTIIRNNVVHKVSSSNVWGSAGILVSGESWAKGDNNIVYNNMVYDIQCTSTNALSRLTGIQIFNQDNPGIYYNSVYLSGTGTNQQGSAAFYISTGCTNVDAKNNIFVNTRNESPYCASAIYDYALGNLSPDYNDLYYDDTNQNSCLVRIYSTKYNTLTDWQATGKDLNSITEMPNFKEPFLHIDESFVTLIDSGATPIEINTDFDGDARNAATPDIGADEFEGIVGIEEDKMLPTEYALEQNYPNPFNPSTLIRYQLPAGTNVLVKIYGILGNEIATLVDEYKSVGRYEVEFNAANLPSGVYFYQLKAGDYTAVRKMILLK